MKYNHKEIEKKWQKVWDEKEPFKAKDDFSLKKFYALVEFPYPSGQGLHVGHPRPYTGLDIIARIKRMQGYNVLYPFGWDAFGLPTENYAMKTGRHPKDVTDENIKNFKKQVKSLGISFDWSREVNTTDPSYYKWTQWIFLKLFKKGLAYKKEANVNYCTCCKVVLANEEVVNGVCERCGGEVVRKVKSQWMLKITAYAERLLKDLDTVDYPDRVKLQQKNWIGKSVGANIKFKTITGDIIEVFTSRPETVFGVTFLVLAPEHPLVSEWLKDNLIKNKDEVNRYIKETSKKSDLMRTDLNNEKTGIKLEGVSAKNPLNGEDIPVFIADYVLMDYASGAIMAVPAHDERDKDFAKKFNLDVKDVISETDDIIINSSFLNGLNVEDAKEKIISFIIDEKIGSKKTNYKLRDWVFSRQRYWGEPIPIIICPKCGYVPVPEEELPLRLPEIKDYKPSINGDSPLVNAESFVNVKCPNCKCDAKRETDTMPQWAGSSWYYIRYIDPKNNNEIASKDKINYWLPVDWYNGGMEHTTLHLLYSRFWHKFLYDIGIVNTIEPYTKRTSHGVILGENNEKMSKSRGNVINPDDVVNEYGADTLRLYEMFIGDFESAAPWSTQSIKGCRRFIERYYNLGDMLITEDQSNIRQDLRNDFNKTIKKVTADVQNLKFNTAIASLMELLNLIYKKESVNKEELRLFSVLLNPFAPHVTEEVWNKLNLGKDLICYEKWPEYSDINNENENVNIVVQVNGKLKDSFSAPFNTRKEEVLKVALNLNKIKKYVDGKTLVKSIYVENKLINLVVR